MKVIIVICKLQAFGAAWEAACKVEASIMVVPNGVFLVGPITFGPDCQPNIVFQVIKGGQLGNQTVIIDPRILSIIDKFAFLGLIF